MSASAPSRVVSFSEASQIVFEHAASLSRNVARPSEVVPLLKSLGRTLAQPIVADRAQPPFARSTRDGFACRSADLNASSRLKVIGQVRAGEVWPASQAGITIGTGEAVEIMTGAPVPAGADCVVMVEHAEREGDAIRLLAQGGAGSLLPGANIVPAGAEAPAGAVVLAAGTAFAAPQIALAAACGAADVHVFTRPRVAIIATGDELVELDQTPLPYQIRNSNSYSLAAQVLHAGAEPIRLAIARDDAAHTEVLVREALAADLVLLSGGVSMGKYDFVEQVLLSMEAEFFFTGARIQPGKPVVFGRFAGSPKYFFGLPGNPISTMVTFALFVEPLLGVLSGRAPSGPRFAQAELKTGLHARTGLTRFLPAIYSSRIAGKIETLVETIAWQGSGDMVRASRANCFLVVPADRDSLLAGETVTVLL